MALLGSLGRVGPGASLLILTPHASRGMKRAVMKSTDWNKSERGAPPLTERLDRRCASSNATSRGEKRRDGSPQCSPRIERRFVREACALALLLGLSFSSLGCSALLGRPRLSYTAERELISLRHAQKKAEAEPQSNAVLSYAASLLSVSDELRESIDPEDWQGQLDRSYELLEGAIDVLPDEESSRALVLQSRFLVKSSGGYDSPKLDSMLERAYAKYPSASSGVAYVELLAARGIRSVEATQVCGATFSRFQFTADEAPLVDLLKRCESLVIEGQSLSEAYPQVPAENWEILRGEREGLLLRPELKESRESAARQEYLYKMERFDKKDCKYKGKPLFGRIQVVDSFPDLKVQVVERFADLKAQKVERFPDSCGKWQFVERAPDLKVQFVERFPDLKVQFVDRFPGVE